MVPDIRAGTPIPMPPTPKGKPRPPIVFVWHPCASCGVLSAMPLKRDGTVGSRGAAWAYGPCPFCKGPRIANASELDKGENRA